MRAESREAERDIEERDEFEAAQKLEKAKTDR